MKLTGLWKTVKGHREPSTVEMFRTASRYRDEGRFEEAAQFVARGLRLDAKSVVGRLLSGNLHVIFREMDLARQDYEHVLSHDPTQPRALLGLARLSLEEGDAVKCADLLKRAIARYPDFPEAQALLDVVASGMAQQPTAAPRAARPTTIRIDRLHVPPTTREILITRSDGTIAFAQPRGPRNAEAAQHGVQVVRLASGILVRAGLGELRRALIESTAETVYLRSDADLVLTLTFGGNMEIGLALGHLDRLWAGCVEEMADKP